MKLGHVHLKVRDLQRAVDFYSTHFGLSVTERIGDQFAFLSGSHLHHEIALQAVGPSAPHPTRGAVGLYHTAFEVESRDAFAAAYHRLQSTGIQVSAVDHRISWACYFSDPDGNGLEIYVDTRNDPDGAESWQGVSRPIAGLE